MSVENRVVILTLKDIEDFHELTQETFSACGFSPEFREVFIVALCEKFHTPDFVKTALKMFDSSYMNAVTLIAPGISVLVEFRLVSDKLSLEFNTCDIVLRYSGKGYCSNDDVRLVIGNIINDYSRHISGGCLND